MATSGHRLDQPYGPLPFSANAGDQAVISPYVSDYELDARLATGDTANAEALLTTEWGHMIAAGPDNTGTMWENVASSGAPGFGPSSSLSHGWSSTPTSALSGYLLGIQPVTAGYATWLVQPHPGDLARAEGQAPTPHGAVQVTAGPTGSTFCAPENGVCSFTGPATVAYGAGSSFTQKSLTSGAPCDNGVFGDPDYGVVKACFLLPAG